MQAETNTRYVRPFLFALVHLALGEIEPAFHYLNKAREEHEVLLPWINVFFFLDVLRPDPRFQDCCGRSVCSMSRKSDRADSPALQAH